jgi:ParB-like chromosome segregation protein Spo0J
MNIREVPLDDLVLDPNLNLRDRLDDFTVERYADSWDRLPPITVFEVEDRLLVADGFHRHAAAIMLGKRTISVNVLTGTTTEALDFVASANLFHGLPLTRAERRRAVEIKLKLHHDWSDRRMAQELSVSRELVGSIRRRLIEANQIPNLPGRVGADGKLYTSAGLPKDRNENLPRDRKTADDEESTERGRRSMSSAAPPWEETPAAPAANRTAPAAEPRTAAPAAETGPAPRSDAWAQPVEPSSSSIDEMLEMMSKQVMQVIRWTQAEGFVEAFRHASANARGLFLTAALKLGARADQLGRIR